MKVSGRCHFCKKVGTWEGGLFRNQGEAVHRPVDWAALFPWSTKTVPEDCTFSPEDLKQHGITTKFACPNCFRGVG